MVAKNNAKSDRERAGPSRRALAWFREAGNAALIRRGLRGVEKESLRVQARRRAVARARIPRASAPRSRIRISPPTTPSRCRSSSLLRCRSNWETLQSLCDLHATHPRLGTSCSGPRACRACYARTRHSDRVLRQLERGPYEDRLSPRPWLSLRPRRCRPSPAYTSTIRLRAAFWPAYRERDGASESLTDFRSTASWAWYAITGAMLGS